MSDTLAGTVIHSGSRIVSSGRPGGVSEQKLENTVDTAVDNKISAVTPDIVSEVGHNLQSTLDSSLSDFRSEFRVPIPTSIKSSALSTGVITTPNMTVPSNGMVIVNSIISINPEVINNPASFPSAYVPRTVTTTETFYTVDLNRTSNVSVDDILNINDEITVGGQRWKVVSHVGESSPTVPPFIYTLLRLSPPEPPGNFGGGFAPGAALSIQPRDGQIRFDDNIARVYDGATSQWRTVGDQIIRGSNLSAAYTGFTVLLSSSPNQLFNYIFGYAAMNAGQTFSSQCNWNTTAGAAEVSISAFFIPTTEITSSS